jgi:hypothetical protein
MEEQRKNDVLLSQVHQQKLISSLRKAPKSEVNVSNDDEEEDEEEDEEDEEDEDEYIFSQIETFDIKDDEKIRVDIAAIVDANDDDSQF